MTLLEKQMKSFWISSFIFHLAVLGELQIRSETEPVWTRRVSWIHWGHHSWWLEIIHPRVLWDGKIKNSVFPQLFRARKSHNISNGDSDKATTMTSITHLIGQSTERCNPKRKWVHSCPACRRCCLCPASSRVVAKHSVQTRDKKLSWNC